MPELCLLQVNDQMQQQGLEFQLRSLLQHWLPGVNYVGAAYLIGDS